MPFPPLAAAPRRRLFLLLQSRSFTEARVRWARDRALDHAVERERHLRPFLAVKDLLFSSGEPAVPLSRISAQGIALGLPFRAVRFLRLFPSAFAETPGTPAAPTPSFSATPALSALHDAEQLAFSSSRADSASRLLRLLMLSPSRSLPTSLVARLRYDLGLPSDFALSILPDYPDYFNVAGGRELEVVYYDRKLAKSELEKYAERTGGYCRGDPLPFPLSFPPGFELDKKVRKWLDQWQKLPYISPYEDGSHLEPRSDITERRTVAVLHEVLSLMVGKKMEKDMLVTLGERFGLPPGFRKVIMNHPGIFYVSNKLRTQTVVLREAYRRHLLVDKDPVMGMRYQFMHLMRSGKEDDGKLKDRKNRRTAKLTMEEEEFENVFGGEQDGGGDDSEEDETEDDDVEEQDEVDWMEEDAQERENKCRDDQMDTGGVDVATKELEEDTEESDDSESCITESKFGAMGEDGQFSKRGYRISMTRHDTPSFKRGRGRDQNSEHHAPMRGANHSADGRSGQSGNGRSYRPTNRNVNRGRGRDQNSEHHAPMHGANHSADGRSGQSGNGRSYRPTNRNHDHFRNKEGGNFKRKGRCELI